MCKCAYGTFGGRIQTSDNMRHWLLSHFYKAIKSTFFNMLDFFFLKKSHQQVTDNISVQCFLWKSQRLGRNMRAKSLLWCQLNINILWTFPPKKQKHFCLVITRFYISGGRPEETFVLVWVLWHHWVLHNNNKRLVLAKILQRFVQPRASTFQVLLVASCFGSTLHH